MTNKKEKNKESFRSLWNGFKKWMLVLLWIETWFQKIFKR